MTDDIWTRQEPDSPCKKVCVIHEDSGLCVGCFRTRQEIAGWRRLSAEDRRALMAELPAREPLLTARGARSRRRRRRGDGA